MVHIVLQYFNRSPSEISSLRSLLLPFPLSFLYATDLHFTSATRLRYKLYLSDLSVTNTGVGMKFNTSMIIAYVIPVVVGFQSTRIISKLVSNEIGSIHWHFTIKYKQERKYVAIRYFLKHELKDVYLMLMFFITSSLRYYFGELILEPNTFERFWKKYYRYGMVLV